jgi:hypothetical protein
MNSLAIAGSLLAVPLWAVDINKKEPLPYRLVGSISGNQQKMQDVALIRDVSSDRTLVLRAGERFGDGSAYLLKSIGEKHVIVVKGDAEIRYDYAPWDRPVEEKSEPIGPAEPLAETDENEFDDPLMQEQALTQAHYSALYLRYLNRILSEPAAEESSEEEQIENSESEDESSLP